MSQTQQSKGIKNLTVSGPASILKVMVILCKEQWEKYKLANQIFFKEKMTLFVFEVSLLLWPLI